MSEASASTPVAASADRSLWANLRDVVLEPSATFDDVGERPRWLAPLIVVMVATLVLTIVMMPLYEAMQAVKLGANASLSPEQREQAVQTMQKFKWVGAAIAPFAVAVISGLFALILWGWAAISGARNAIYKVAFTAVVYTGVIGILQSIAQAIVLYVKGPDQLAREGGPPTFGLALFLDRGDLPLLVWGMLANVNFFAVWTAIVVAIAGVHALRMSKGSATGVAIFTWLVSALFLALGAR